MIFRWRMPSWGQGKGLTIPVVYNTNAMIQWRRCDRSAAWWISYLPDIKYMDNALGKRYSAVLDYAEIIPASCGRCWIKWVIEGER